MIGTMADQELDVVLEAAWKQVLEGWDDPSVHERFLVLAQSTQRLAWAGARYREVKEKDPDPARREEAQRRIEEILTLAVSSLRVDRSEPSRVKSRLEWIAYGVSAVLLATALLRLFRALGGSR
jgi:hypothetical protein